MKTCPQCHSQITIRRNTFCNKVCASRFNNANRVKNISREERRNRQRQYYKNWQINNPDSAKKTSVKSFSNYYNTVGGRAEHMLNNARQRAKRQAVFMTLTKEWIKERLEKGICEVTGLPFVIQGNNGKGHNINSFSPSIDRINQTGDYSPENCRLVVWIYNRARGAFPDKDFDTLVEALQGRVLS